MAETYYNEFSAPKNRYTNSMYTEGDFGVAGALKAAAITELGAVLTQKIYTISPMTDVSDWTEETSGQLDAADNAEGPLLDDKSMRLTQTAAGKTQVYIDYSTPIDLAAYDKIGFWYKGGPGDVFAAGDLQVLIFTNGVTAAAQAAETLNVPAIATEPTPAVWKYAEISFANAATLRKKVTRIAFYSAATTLAGNFMDVVMLENYKYGYGNGPALGTIRRNRVENGVTVVQGDYLQLESNGRANLADDQSTSFAGLALAGAEGNAAGTIFIDYVEDGIVNLKSTEILTAGDGVVPDHATNNTVDDGDAASLRLQIGTALVTCIANDLVPCMLKNGDVGAVGA